MQVANDVASAKELPSCEARPGRRVNNSAAGKLQGGELREDCVEGALSVVSLAESAAFVAYEASSVASALAPWSAVMLAILVSTSSGVSSPSTVESRAASAGVRLAEGGVQGCRGDSVQEGCRYLRVHRRGSVHGRLQGVRCQGAGVRLGGLQPRDGGVSACLGVHLQRRDPCCCECWSTTVLRPQLAATVASVALLAEAMELFMAAVVL